MYTIEYSVCNYYSDYHYNYYNYYRIIQISRPRLNCFIILGAILLYFSMLLFVIPTKSKSTYLVLAKIQPWTMSLGFSFCYGTIIMKMFRVYYIVHNPLPNKVGWNV